MRSYGVHVYPVLNNIQFANFWQNEYKCSTTATTTEKRRTERKQKINLSE